MFKRSKLLLFFVPALLLAVLAYSSSAVAEPIGLVSVEASTVNENGSPDIQAGSHPYALVTSFRLTKAEEVKQKGATAFVPTGGGVKNVRVENPPGFAGNPNATPRCNYTQFAEKACPADTAVGTATTTFVEGTTGDEIAVSNPVFNLETPGGIAAEFGYRVNGIVPILINATVRTGTDYGVTASVRNTPEILALQASTVKIWGVPASPSHNSLRGYCLREDPTLEGETHEELSGGECPVDVPVEPLLTNPTSCGVPRTGSVAVESWGESGGPGKPSEPSTKAEMSDTLPELVGCEKLNFSPTINVTPDGTDGSTPTGLNVALRVPQESTTNPEGLGEADVEDTTVALPPGVQISPSASDGLQACSNAQIGFEGYRELDGSGMQTATFSPGAPTCPNASKIATVSVATPLLEHELKGDVYLAAPQNFVGLPENPFSSLVALYLVAEEPHTGVLIKLAGKVSLNPVTGQILTTFEDTPELPFSELKLEFYGTDRAPLATPALCGTYNTESTFVPWSGTAAAQPVSDFQITSGPNGTPCSDPLPFAPVLNSGTTNINAGSFSELTTTMSREDGQQSLSAIQLHYPAGISGLLSSVKLCAEQQANEGTCGPESEIGETIVSVGLDNDPFTVTGGKVFITGPYEGAPFGLSILNPAKAGPYVLQEGRPVVVRAKIEVNPITAALTVTTNTPGSPHAIPTIIEGIPLQIKHVYVNINRPGFTFNPTNCTPTAVTGTIDSAEGASSPVSIPFQVTNCGSLKFTPTFAVSTSGKTSKSDGASLTATVTEPSDPQGQANIGRVKVELPKQLPSRLTTLQKACLAKVFEENPAACPGPSFIGHAVVHTKLLPVPLEGPAIFVSHGGEAFPSLEIVLQGDNVTIDLVGATFISKSGITSTTFKTLPDQPFETFSLTLSEGPYSALAANGNLCAPTATKTVKKKVTVKIKGRKKTETRKVTETTSTTLQMPNEFVAQNGAVIKQATDISVTGCAKAKPAKKAKKTKQKSKRGNQKK